MVSCACQLLCRPMDDRLERLVRQYRRKLLNRDELAGEIVELLHRDRALLPIVAGHADADVRRGAVVFLSEPWPWPDPSRAAADVLLRDEDPEVRAPMAAVVEARGRPVTELPANGYEVRYLLANADLARTLVDELIAAGDPYTLELLATNPGLPPDVRQAVIRRANPAPGSSADPG